MKSQLSFLIVLLFQLLFIIQSTIPISTEEEVDPNDEASSSSSSRSNNNGGGGSVVDFIETDESQTTNGKEDALNKYWNSVIKSSARITLTPAAAADNNNNSNSILVDSAAKLSTFLQQFAELELAIKETKASYESVSFDMKHEKSPSEKVQELANRMTEEMAIYQDALERMVTVVKMSYKNKHKLIPTMQQCCEMSPQQFQYREDYKSFVGLSSACTSIPQSTKRAKKSLFVPGKELNDVLISNAERLPHLKWQYFVSPDGVQIQFPSNTHNCPSLSPLSSNNNGYYGAYENKTFGSSSASISSSSSSAERTKKPLLFQKSTKTDTQIHRIIFLIQLDSNTTETMIKSIKTIVFQLLKLLDESDEVGIINSEPDQLWSNFICDQMLRTTSWTRFQILNYLNYLENRYKSNPTFENQLLLLNNGTPDHFLGLQKAIEMACTNSSSSDSSSSDTTSSSSSPFFPPIATTLIQLSSTGIDITKFKSRFLHVNCPIFIESFFLQPYNNSSEELFRKTMANIAITKNILRVQVFSTAQTDSESFAEKVALQLKSKKEWWSLSDILSQFFPQESNYTTSTTSSAVPSLNEFSLPHWNHVLKDSVIVGKRYVFSDGRPLGLVSMEIPLLVFTQHLITFTPNDNTCDAKNYAFLIDKNGKVVLHPAFGNLANKIHFSTSTIPIEQVEIYNGFPILKKRIISESNGCGSIYSKSDKTWITYAWATTLNSYIVVIALFGENNGCDSIDGTKYTFTLKRNALNTHDIQHHLLLDKTLCCNNQLISINKAGLYLNINAFHRPVDSNLIGKDNEDEGNEDEVQDKKRLLSLMAFIGDQSGMIQNRKGVLKSVTKYHIGVLGPTIQIYKQRYFQSAWNKYILRRFISAGSGSFLVTYPGVQITAGYNPKSTSWFRKAINGDGNLIFSPPFFDPQIKLPLITISQSIKLGISNGPFNPIMQEKSVSVVGTHLHAGFLQKLIEDLLPDCRYSMGMQGTMKNSTTTRCFLFDENGLVIYHPHLIGTYHTTTINDDPIHLSQVEPLSFIDMLQQQTSSSSSNNGHGGHYGRQQQQQQPLITKFMCNKVSSTQGSLKRIYKFSMDKNGIYKLKQNVGGSAELCNYYYIVPVLNTNLYLGYVHDNCSSSITAFCPCSRVDNLCLNCLRMEPTDCECPCECPREPGFCLKKTLISDLPEDILPCEFPEEELPMVRINSKANVECDVKNAAAAAALFGGGSKTTIEKHHLSCEYLRPSTCSSILQSSQCLGSWDCEWCPIASNSLNSSATTSTESCLKYSECYKITNQSSLLRLNHKRINDLLAGGTDSNSDYEIRNDSQITLVPIIAVFSVFIIFIALVIYCYRHRVLSLSDSQPNLHLLPLQETLGSGLLPPGGTDNNSHGESDDSETDNQLPIQAPIVVLNRRRHGPGGGNHNNAAPHIQPPRSPVASSVSDLGYSTMTGENISECAGPVVVPIVINPPPPAAGIKSTRHLKKPLLQQQITNNCTSASSEINLCNSLSQDNNCLFPNPSS